MRLGTQAQEAAKRGDGVNDMAANLLDDEPLDGSDLLAIRVVNSGALDVIALDQRVAWSRGRICLCHSSFPPVVSVQRAAASEPGQSDADVHHTAGPRDYNPPPNWRKTRENEVRSRLPADPQHGLAEDERMQTCPKRWACDHSAGRLKGSWPANIALFDALLSPRLGWDVLPSRHLNG